MATQNRFWQDLEAFTGEQVPRCSRFYALNDTESLQLLQSGTAAAAWYTHKLWAGQSAWYGIGWVILVGADMGKVMKLF